MTSLPVALLNARLLDPATGTETPGGVLVENGCIVEVGAKVTKANVGARTEVVDCAGDIVSPGLIDMCVFVGEPGASHRETIATASRAAAAGGVTTIVAAPNTNPPMDGAASVDYLMRRARDNARVRVLPCAALTKGLAGIEIAEIGLLQEAGAVAFSNGPNSVVSSQVMRRAMIYARDFNAIVIHRAEDPELARSGVMNEGEFASRIGLPGIPREAEAIILDRDMRLVALTFGDGAQGGHYHAQMVTTTLSLEIIAKAKAAGLPVSCATSINHLTLNESDIGQYRTFLKLSPPLRAEEERMALVEALAGGLIDVIMSDHNPQDVEAKRVPFSEAEYGAIGLETMLSAGLRLVRSGQVSLGRLINAMTVRPAEILGLPQGRLQKGAPADLIRFDPDEPYVVDPSRLQSRSKNTPFDEARLEGVVKLTMVAGTIV
ncbi:MULTISPECIES: dihydroorotase [unclassified Beijerinckia]|uniref:dihydroorotase n=1 Tax=unclassified Beijerinckia TaxID=2638183 RepID=UPI00089C3D83|nr:MULTISPECIES: dihydroorotase [unclassified Beijerinckia]MDH7794543.1 dihydroorotase [Beijerinckia sp. GAS462]SEB65983.1 dihydroorotase [Beijerinckia sp. 28-YEA-48]